MIQYQDVGEHDPAPPMGPHNLNPLARIGFTIWAILTRETFPDPNRAGLYTITGAALLYYLWRALRR